MSTNETPDCLRTPPRPAAAALWGRQIKFDIYFDRKFGAFPISPLMQSVICGCEGYSYDNKLKAPAEKLFRTQ